MSVHAPVANQQQPSAATAPRPATRTSASNSRGLTTRGRCLLAGGVAAIVCAVILDERDLLRVGILAVAVPLIAWAITATRKTALNAVHKIEPELIRPGTSGRITLTVTNSGRGRTRPVEITEDPSPDLTAGVHCLLPSLSSGRSAIAVYRLRATRRGRFLLGPPRAQLADPFGVWSDNRTLDAVTEVLVVPTVVELHGMPASAGTQSAASGRTSVGTVGGEPDVSIRPYQRGDDLRTVHWRMSARHDDLMVRMNEPVSHGGATILLDHRALAHDGAGSQSSMETGITFAASIALHLLTADHRVTLRTHDGSVLADGHDIADDVLAALAMVTADTDQTIDQKALSEPGLLIAVMGHVDEETARLMAASRRRSANAICILLETAGWASATAAQRSQNQAAAVLGASGWRIVTVRRPDDLGQAWRQVCAIGRGFDRRTRV